MYDKSQMMRGTLEGCILKIISVETTYGYEIVMKLQDFGFEDMKEGTIYPLLVRLEKKKMISSEFRPSPLGPSRKYYSLTEAGQEQLREFESCWRSVSDTVESSLMMLEERGGANEEKYLEAVKKAERWKTVESGGARSEIY